MGVINKTLEQLNNIFNFQEATPEGDDRGIKIVNGGQLSIGTKEEGAESIFGGGDSYPVDTAFHCDIANTAGLTITGATDVTNILKSDTGSTTGLFGGTATGKYILVGSDYKFSGVKVKTSVAGVIEPDNILAEIIVDSTPTITVARYMATDSDDTRLQLGREITTRPSEHWYFGVNPITFETPWEKATLTINGQPITKYWGRFRIVSPITQDAVIEQIKQHTNRTEINATDGLQFFGDHRFQDVIFAGMRNYIPNTNKNPLNQNISIGANTTGEYTNNQFNNNTEDGFLIPVTIPVGLDTSIPLILNITGYPTTDTAGVVKFGADVFAISNGFIYDGTAVPDSVLTATDDFPSGSLNKRRTAQFLIPVNKLVPTEEVVISFYRMGNDPEDTLDGNAVITNIECIGTFWRL